MWSTVNNLSNKSKQNPPRMIIYQNNKIISIKKISYIANKFVIEKVIDLRYKLIMPIYTAMNFLTFLVDRNNNELKLRPITIDQSLDIMKFTKSTNSVDSDCISMRVVKKINKLIAPHLIHMINCISTSSKYQK